MKLKNKIYLIEFSIIIVVGIFLTTLFFTYNKKLENDLQTNITNIIEINKENVKEILNSVYTDYESNKKLFYNIHQYTQSQYLQNTTIDLETLKQSIIKKFNLQNIGIDIFLIDNFYTITNATFKKDIGFNLSIIEDAKNYLDKTSKDKKIYVASNISIDMLDSNLKTYSYSKIKNNLYFEMGFKFNNPIYKKLKDNLDNIYKKTHNKIFLYRVLDSSNNTEIYDNVLKAEDLTNISKEQYYKTLQNFKKDEPTTNKYINTIRFNKTYKESVGHKVVYYVPLLSKKDNQHLFYNNFLMKIEIDISSHLKNTVEIQNYFIAFSVVLLLLLIGLYYIIKNSFYNPMVQLSDIFEKELEIKDKHLLEKKDEFGLLVEKYNKIYKSLNKEIHLNQNLLLENKKFIADTVHQIRTPLTNIMMNSEMIKRSQKDDTMLNFIDQINASINMLTNSYEDLSYITSFDTIEYKPINLSITDILSQRVKFFTTISKVNFKEIVTDIQPNIYFNINQIELERLIDNNISNAIKYADTHKPITINLTKENDIVSLKFKSFGNPIKNTSKIFDKNYREDDSKRGLGLGLNMVKGICEKYDIDYEVSYEDKQNIFTYKF